MMDLNNPSLGGAILFFAYTFAYLVLFLLLQLKLSKGPQKKREAFVAQAIREGRMVTAPLVNWERVLSSDPDDPGFYRADYRYTAPDGRDYHCTRHVDRIWSFSPPEHLTLYLYPDNYGRYMTQQETQQGKHGGAFFLATWIPGLILYWILLNLFVIR